MNHHHSRVINDQLIVTVVLRLHCCENATIEGWGDKICLAITGQYVCANFVRFCKSLLPLLGTQIILSKHAFADWDNEKSMLVAPTARGLMKEDWVDIRKEM